MISVNLLPWRRIRDAQRRKNVKSIMIAGGIVCIVFYFLFFQKKMSPLPPQFKTIKKLPVITLPKAKVFKPQSPIFSDDWTRAENFLKVTPLHNLKWTGFLIKQNHISVFITSPNGFSYLLNLGDEVGLEKARIIEISREHIIFLIRNQKIIWTRPSHVFSI